MTENEAEKFTDTRRLYHENVWLRAWVRDFLVAAAKHQGEVVFEAFTKRELDSLTQMDLRDTATGISRTSAEANERDFTKFIFDVTQQLIQSVVDEARRKFTAGAPKN